MYGNKINKDMKLKDDINFQLNLIVCAVKSDNVLFRAILRWPWGVGAGKGRADGERQGLGGWCKEKWDLRIWCVKMAYVLRKRNAYKSVIVIEIISCLLFFRCRLLKK